MSVAVSTVSASDYLRGLLDREAVDHGPGSAMAQIEGKLAALCQAWGSRHIIDVSPGGGFEKSMANRSGISIDYVGAIVQRARLAGDERAVRRSRYVLPPAGGRTRRRLALSVAS